MVKPALALTEGNGRPCAKPAGQGLAWHGANEPLRTLRNQHRWAGAQHDQPSSQDPAEQAGVMARQVDMAGLVAAAQALLARPGRHVLAIAGAPGSGKSTLVAALWNTLEAQAPGGSAILPMDGFHYDDAVLQARGRRPWKGAPDTFDVGGLRATLQRLRTPAEGAVAVPVFDRGLEISRGSARIIDPAARLILAEGNYLLLRDDPWCSLRPLFDLTVRIDVPEPELRRRLRRRWQGFGLTKAEIEAKLEGNDLPNGRKVLTDSSPPDLILAPGARLSGPRPAAGGPCRSDDTTGAAETDD